MAYLYGIYHTGGIISRSEYQKTWDICDRTMYVDTQEFKRLFPDARLKK